MESPPTVRVTALRNSPADLKRLEKLNSEEGTSRASLFAQKGRQFSGSLKSGMMSAVNTAKNISVETREYKYQEVIT